MTSARSSGKNVVIVGGGVIGLSVAYHCLKRGHGVTVLERGSEGRDCCSLGNAGLVVPSHFVPLAAPGMIAKGLRWMFNPTSPFYIRPRLRWDLIKWGWNFYRAATRARVLAAAPILRDLSLRSRKLFEELDATDGFDFGLERRGLLMLCKTAAMLEEEAEMVTQAKALGIDATVLDPSALAEVDPGIRMTVAGAVHFPQDCHLSPNRFVANLQNTVVREGGRIVWEAEVTGFRRTKIGHIESVQTGEKSFATDECVIATGAWSPAVAAMLPDTRLSIQPGKGYSITVAEPPAIPEVSSILCEAKVAVTPMVNQSGANASLRFGGTMEITGYDESINRRRVTGILDAIPRYFPEFENCDLTAEPVWTGLRPCTPDGLPYIGRCRSSRNLTIAAGHGMLGLSLAPVSGEIVSAIISNEDPGIDLSLLSPDRH